MHRNNNADNRKTEPQVELESQFIMRLPPVIKSNFAQK